MKKASGPFPLGGGALVPLDRTLEIELGGQLQDPRVPRRENPPEIGAGKRVVRVQEVRPVQAVENLPANLETPLLIHLEGLEQAGIQILQAGAVQNVPAGSAEGAQRRQREGRGVEEVRDLAVDGLVVISGHRMQ